MNDVVQANMGQLEQVLIGGDLARLSPQDRILYYKTVCESVGLNPLTKPFEYINLNGKLTLYALRTAAEQLRKVHGVSVVIKAREVVEDCYVVTAGATDAKGRSDESIGAVNIAGLKGEARANAMMKAETKAKRRVTLSICGLGMLDETEIETISHAITPTTGVMASLPGKDQDTIAATAQEIRGLIGNDQHHDAYAMWQDSRFDAEQTVALWGCLNSKERKILERIDAETKAAEKGVISPAQHKRLEAVIKENGYDREAIKSYCKDIFGVEHFTKLTPEQYKRLDSELDRFAAPNAPAQVATSPGDTPALPPVPAAGAPVNEATQVAPSASRETAEAVRTPAVASPFTDSAEIRALSIENALDIGGSVTKAKFKGYMAKEGWHSYAEIPEDRFKAAMKWINAEIDKKNAREGATT